MMAATITAMTARITIPVMIARMRTETDIYLLSSVKQPWLLGCLSYKPPLVHPTQMIPIIALQKKKKNAKDGISR